MQKRMKATLKKDLSAVQEKLSGDSIGGSGGGLGEPVQKGIVFDRNKNIQTK